MAKQNYFATFSITYHYYIYINCILFLKHFFHTFMKTLLINKENLNLVILLPKNFFNRKLTKS